VRVIRHPVGYTLPVLQDRINQVTYDPDTNQTTSQPYPLNDPDISGVDLTLTPEAGGTPLLVQASMLVAPGTTGDVSYAWQPADVAQLGRVVALEEIVHAGGAREAVPAYLIEFYDPAAATPSGGVLCGSWLDASTLTCTGVTQADADAASEFLYVASGRKYPGVCTSTVRPCVDAWCGCGWDWCLTCGRPDGMARLFDPVISIGEVTIDGEVLDASEYRVYEGRYLQRIGVGWPWQNMSVQAGEVGSWTVTFTHGAAPPPLGVEAAGKLACHFAEVGEACTLPAHVQSLSRLGVNQVFDPRVAAALDLPSVATFLGGYGVGETQVWSPDLPPYPAEVL
jgi:hypothetical protein